jgi:hypothetical protein
MKRQLTFDREPIWERQTGDTKRSFQAFQDYLKLPSFGRSVKTLFDTYSYQIRTNGPDLPPVTVPSRSKETLLKWCSTYRFKERAAAYDEAMKLTIEERQRQLRDEALEQRLEAEMQEVEEFRVSCITLGKNGVAFANDVIELISRVPKEMQGKPLQQKDLDRLSKVSVIYKNVTSGLVSGHDYWAQALGIDQALAKLDQKQTNATE